MLPAFVLRRLTFLTAFPSDLRLHDAICLQACILPISDLQRVRVLLGQRFKVDEQALERLRDAYHGVKPAAILKLWRHE